MTIDRAHARKLEESDAINRLCYLWSMAPEDSMLAFLYRMVKEGHVDVYAACEPEPQHGDAAANA